MPAPSTGDPPRPSARPPVVVAAAVLLVLDAAATLVSVGFTPYDGVVNVWDCAALLGFAAAAVLVWVLWRRAERVVVVAWVWSLGLVGLPFCGWLGFGSAQTAGRVVALLGAVMVLAPALLLTLSLLPGSRR